MCERMACSRPKLCTTAYTVDHTFFMYTFHSLNTKRPVYTIVYKLTIVLVGHPLFMYEYM